MVHTSDNVTFVLIQCMQIFSSNYKARLLELIAPENLLTEYGGTSTGSVVDNTGPWQDILHKQPELVPVEDDDLPPLPTPSRPFPQHFHLQHAHLQQLGAQFGAQTPGRGVRCSMQSIASGQDTWMSCKSLDLPELGMSASVELQQGYVAQHAAGAGARESHTSFASCVNESLRISRVQDSWTGADLMQHPSHQQHHPTSPFQVHQTSAFMAMHHLGHKPPSLRHTQEDISTLDADVDDVDAHMSHVSFHSCYSMETASMLAGDGTAPTLTAHRSGNRSLGGSSSFAVHPGPSGQPRNLSPISAASSEGADGASSKDHSGGSTAEVPVSCFNLRAMFKSRSSKRYAHLQEPDTKMEGFGAGGKAGAAGYSTPQPQSRQAPDWEWDEPSPVTDQYSGRKGTHNSASKVQHNNSLAEAHTGLNQRSKCPSKQVLLLEEDNLNTADEGQLLHGQRRGRVSSSGGGLLGKHFNPEHGCCIIM